jgi:hypothetical protein
MGRHRAVDKLAVIDDPLTGQRDGYDEMARSAERRPAGGLLSGVCRPDVAGFFRPGLCRVHWRTLAYLDSREQTGGQYGIISEIPVWN